MLSHLVTLGLQLGAYALTELTYSFLVHITVNPADFHIVFTHAAILLESKTGTSANKFVSVHV